MSTGTAARSLPDPRRRGRQLLRVRERPDYCDGLGRNDRRHGDGPRGWMLVRSRERAIQRL